MPLDKIYEYIDSNSQRFIDDLVRLVRQPSVSARKEGMQECAEIVEEMMKEIGISTRIIPEEEGNPVVFGEIRSKLSKKTLLFYDHYDVQPPEPLEEWIYDPFSGEVHDGKIYGRGTSDNKGNIVSRLKAIQAFLETTGSVPINIKFVIEGEEEIGSVAFFRDLREMRRLEQQFADQERLLHQDKMISLGRLAASVVHEINNPLAGVLNYARLMLKIMKRGPLSGDYQEKFSGYLNLMENETNRCSCEKED